MSKIRKKKPLETIFFTNKILKKINFIKCALQDLTRKKDQVICLHVQFDQIACNKGDKAL